MLTSVALNLEVLGRSGGRQPSAQQLKSIAVDTLAAATALPQWDLICGCLAAAGAYGLVKTFDALAGAGILDQKLSRKLVHSTAGPLFVLTWPFFSDLPQARLVAAVVPCINLARLLLVGSGVLSDPGLVHSVSRQGDRSELLKGPLCYVLVLIGITLAFWRDNPAGTIAVSMMCGGDGFADIIGRRLGSSKLPWNPSKSWAGSTAMFVAGLAMASGFFWLFCTMGYFECFSLQVALPYLVAVCGACTVVESLPIGSWFDDNLSVPLVAVAVSMLVFPLAANVTAACTTQQPQQHLVQLLSMQ
eukprot:gene10842-10997_t